MINAEILFMDERNYNEIRIKNNTRDSVIVPAGTHVVGGHQNRGVDEVHILKPSDFVTADAHCYEPSRGSGSDRFTQVSETPIDVVFRTMTSKGYSESWNMIETYTRLMRKVGGSALQSFLEGTEKDRIQLALNFETASNQTGVLSTLGKEYVMLEVFPNHAVFNQYRTNIYRGKIASLLWKKVHENNIPHISPAEVSELIAQFFRRMRSDMQNVTPTKTVQGKYTMYNIRKSGFIADYIVGEDDVLIYMFVLTKN